MGYPRKSWPKMGTVKYSYLNSGKKCYKMSRAKLPIIIFMTMNAVY